MTNQPSSASQRRYRRPSRRDVLAGTGAALALPMLGLSPARAQILGADGGTAYVRAVGEIEVTALLDGYLELGRDLLVEVEPETVTEALGSAFLDPDQPLQTGITAHLLRTGGQLILVDTGASSVFGPTAGRLEAALANAGVAPDEIGLVLITHMHGDHIAGLLRDGVPTFPEAEIRIAEADLAFWTDEANLAQAPAAAQPSFALARTVAEAYGDRITPFTGDADIAPGVTSIALPGHTPGHSGYRISSGDAALLLWGDIVHIAAVQFPYPQASLAFDTDPAQAAETRARVLDMVAADGMLVAGAHLPFPAFGYAEAAAEGYAWQPEAWQYR